MNILSNIKCRWHRIRRGTLIFVHIFSVPLDFFAAFNLFGICCFFSVSVFRFNGQSKSGCEKRHCHNKLLMDCDHIVIYCFWLFDAAKYSSEEKGLKTGTCLQKIYWQKLYSVDYSRSFISIWWFFFLSSHLVWWGGGGCCCCSIFNEPALNWLAIPASHTHTYCTNIAVSDTSTTNCTISRSRRSHVYDSIFIYSLRFFLFLSLSIAKIWGKNHFVIYHEFAGVEKSTKPKIEWANMKIN